MGKPKTLVRRIETLGEQSDYEGQAAEFLDYTGAVVEARYMGMRPHFTEDDDVRDVYEVRITRGSRSHTFEYGDSVDNTEERLAEMLGREYDYLAPRVRKEQSVGNSGHFYESRLRKWAAAHSEWMNVRDKGAGRRPSAYSVLSSLVSHEPPQDVDTFAEEFGYTKPSNALRVFEAVRNEWQAMCRLFTDDELEALQCIV